jgi:hypothetical protein
LSFLPSNIYKQDKLWLLEAQAGTKPLGILILGSSKEIEAICYLCGSFNLQLPKERLNIAWYYRVVVNQAINVHSQRLTGTHKLKLIIIYCL